MTDLILTIDQGTTGTTVSLLDTKGHMVEKYDEDFPQIYPHPGWVEHNPEDIWQTVLNGIQYCTKKLKPESRIAAIGITNQRETVVMWDRLTGKPVYNAIVWQCRRTSDFCTKLKKNKKIAKMVAKKTGLVIDPYFSSSKIRWLLKEIVGSKDKSNLLVGTIDCYLIWKLTGGKSHKTDVSNASRTMLMNIETGNWDPELLKLFQVPASILPEIVSSNARFGNTRQIPGLPDGIPITGVAGDQQAALFGQACFKAGEAKCTYGTGSFILLNCGTKRVNSKSGLLTTIAWRLEGEKKMTYALEGGAFNCGSAVQWLRDGLGLFSTSSEIEKLASSVPDTLGVEFVPALTGLGAPHWKPYARGMISGLTRGATKAHIARATLEGMALQNVDILRAMEKDSGTRLKTLKVDGGASANNLLMQIQADYIGAQILRPKNIETTTMGAAFLAGLGEGIWQSLDEIKKVFAVDQDFMPKMSKHDRQKRIGVWTQAVKRLD